MKEQAPFMEKSPDAPFVEISGKRRNIRMETFETVDRMSAPASRLRWSHPFLLPFWIRVLCKTLEEPPPLWLAVHENGEAVGAAPLVVSEHRARLFGNPDVSDYADLATAPGMTEVFFQALRDYLVAEGIRSLEMLPVRPDAIAVTELLPFLHQVGMRFTLEEIDATYTVPLPGTWSDYLQQLSGHQRHEVRRKLRGLSRIGSYRFVDILGSADAESAMERFIAWFRAYHSGKAAFLDSARMAYFTTLASTLAEKGMLRLFVLEIEGVPGAMTFCIEYDDTLYLYNNAYDPRFETLSIGTLSKVLSLREGIRRGLKVFDFLKGEEPYKARLGGRRLPLYRISIHL